MGWAFVRRARRGGAGLLALGIVSLVLPGCGRPAAVEPAASGPYADVPRKLSEYALFTGNGSTQQPVDGVIPYELNTPLFSDYMLKYRFVKLPPGTTAQYHPQDEFAFPVGTIIAKTFACPVDLRDPSLGQRLLETRILSRTPDRGWIGMAYIWNEDQTEAELELAGGTVDVSWIHTDGTRRQNNYIIPNANQCKGCHKHRAKQMLPIGPRARHLNRDFAYAHGTENQLAYWSRTGALAGAPEPDHAPRLAVWDDPRTGDVDARARAWLDINCAHCHNPLGPARNSGLDLSIQQNEPYQWGVYRQPVAAGSGSGDRRFDIVPGDPEASILLYRVASTHPGVMMPELGKRLVHTEGVELVREWIAQMPPRSAPATP